MEFGFFFINKKEVGCDSIKVHKVHTHGRIRTYEALRTAS